MKKLSILILITCTFFSCSEDDNVSLAYLRAAIHNACDNNQNFTGTDIYGYEVSDMYFGTYWQVGAHPSDAVNEQPDLGMNIFNENLESGQYDISGDSFSINSVFIYYIDANGIEYVSTSNLEGVVNISNDETTVEIIVNTAVTLYSYETEQSICVSNFEAKVLINQ